MYLFVLGLFKMNLLLNLSSFSSLSTNPIWSESWAYQGNRTYSNETEHVKEIGHSTRDCRPNVSIKANRQREASRAVRETAVLHHNGERDTSHLRYPFIDTVTSWAYMQLNVEFHIYNHICQTRNTLMWQKRTSTIMLMPKAFCV